MKTSTGPPHDEGFELAVRREVIDVLAGELRDGRLHGVGKGSGGINLFVLGASVIELERAAGPEAETNRAEKAGRIGRLEIDAVSARLFTECVGGTEANVEVIFLAQTGGCQTQDRDGNP